MTAHVMRALDRWSLLLVLLAVLATTTIAACANNADEEVIKTGGANVLKRTHSISPNFPTDFPLYKGANLHESLESTHDGVRGFQVTWFASDSFDRVRSFYDASFSQSGWSGNNPYVSDDYRSTTRVPPIAVIANGPPQPLA